MIQSSKLLLIVLALAFVSGCSSWFEPNACVDLAERGATGAQIGSAPPPAGQSPALCAAVSQLVEKRYPEARTALETLAEATAPQQRWMVQGYLAMAILGSAEPNRDTALQLSDAAIAGAVKAGDVHRETRFRMNRGLTYVRAEEFGPALADFQRSYDIAPTAKWKAQAADSAFGVAVASKHLELARSWYPRVMAAARAVNDVKLQSSSAQFYAQMLDEAGLSDESERAYADAVKAAEATSSKELLAEMLEYQAQSRFKAGDYRGVERAYGQAAQLARESGQKEFASQLDDSLRQRLSMFENGNACERLVEQRKFDLAERAVTDVPVERRSWNALACEMAALEGRGDTGRAAQRLESLVINTGTGWKCDHLRAVNARLGNNRVVQSGVPKPLPNGDPRCVLGQSTESVSVRQDAVVWGEPVGR